MLKIIPRDSCLTCVFAHVWILATLRKQVQTLEGKTTAYKCRYLVVTNLYPRVVPFSRYSTRKSAHMQTTVTWAEFYLRHVLPVCECKEVRHSRSQAIICV
jgi:hypothetical protein